MEVDLFELLTQAYEEPLPYQLLKLLTGLMQEKTFRKNEIVLPEGKVSDRLYFIQRGLLRAYAIDDGVEETTWLRAEGQFAVTIPSFYDRTPSDQTIQALERTDVFSLSYSEFRKVLKSNLEFSFIAYNLQNAVLLEWNEWGRKLKKLDMPHRFEWLHDRHPHLIYRTPPIIEKYLASYLGMTPETYSKVKKDFFGLPDSSRILKRKAS